MGFEPTHALRRLTDFESAPLGLLGTSPRRQETLYHIRFHLCNGYFLTVHHIHLMYALHIVLASMDLVLALILF